MTRFEKLFQAGTIGRLQLKNRIIMPPMVPRYNTPDGGISEQMLDYYAERARGGCGLIVVESSYPRTYPGRICLTDDNVIPDIRRLVETVHQGGAKVAIEINPHRGRADEVDPATASETVHPTTGVKVRALTVDDIEGMVEDFGEAVRRVKEAGFDGVMIHGGSGYLVSEFLSPRINKRDDEYGGDARRRARLALDLVAITKAKAGNAFPVMYRMVADERVEGGFGLADAILLAKWLQEAGADGIDVVSGMSIESFPWVVPYMYMPSGCNADLSQAIKKEVNIAISVTGKILDPYLAEEILSEYKADFIDLGRALIADPHFPNKAMAGKVDDICRCTACLRCLESIIRPPGGPMVCTVNPAVGREKEFEARLKPASKKKRVLVIGGGPGGMEAATVAARRGHDVTLWEKEDKLGGTLNLAVAPPGKDDLRSFGEYLTSKLDELKVNVVLGKEATAQAVSEFSPDAIIVACGAKPLIPKIKGLDKRKLVTFRDVLSGKVEVGKSVIVIGGGFVGCELADFLAEKGKKVTVIEILPQLASELFPPVADLVVQIIKNKGVDIFTEVREEEITEKGMEIADKDGKKVSIEADDIVIAAGSVADKSLFEALEGKMPEIYQAGDCVTTRRMQEAVYEGANAGLAI